MSKMIHDIMFILVFLGGGVVFYEERKYPENFEGNPRLFSTRAEFVSRPLKIIQAALAAVLLLAVVPMFFDIQFGLLSKFDEFNLVQGVFVTLATLTLQPVFAYRKSMLSNEQKNN
ncbi:MAG: hypothetical protein MI864_02690 [Pseudomonadales bacterium]|nr:hypothetical protein [Pseudomonadales bacterium]